MLRHLQLPEPQYIPEYIPPSEQLIASTASNIAQQEMQYQQQMNQMDLLYAEQASQLTGLSDQHRMQMQSELGGLRGEMYDYVEQHGARGAQHRIGDWARQFMSTMQPYQQRSAELGSIMERITNSEADGMMKAYVQNKVSSISDDTPLNERINAEEYVGVLDNYIDPREFFTDVQKVIKDRVTAGEIQPGVFGKTTGRHFSEVQSILVEEGLNNRQLMSQFRLEAQMMAESGHLPEEFAAYLDEDGKLDFHKAIQQDLEILDEDGEPTTVQTRATTLLELMTMQRTNAIANARANYGVQLDYDRMFGTGDGDIDFSRIASVVGGVYEAQTIEKYYGDIHENIKSKNVILNEHRRRILNNDLIRQAGFTEIVPDVSNDNELLLIDANGSQTSMSEFLHNIETTGTDEQQSMAFTLRDMLQHKRVTNQLIYEYEQQRNSFEEAVKINLIHSGFEPIVPLISFDEETGNIIFDKAGEITDLTADFIRTNFYELPDSTIDLQEGETTVLSSPRTSTWTGGYGFFGSVGPESNVLYTKLDGKIYALGNESDKFNEIRETAQEYQKRHLKLVNSRREFPMIHFNSEDDKIMIQDLERNLLKAENYGTVIDTAGNTVILEENERLSIAGVTADRGGQIYGVVHVLDNENQIVRENLRLSSSYMTGYAHTKVPEIEGLVAAQGFYSEFGKLDGPGTQNIEITEAIARRSGLSPKLAGVTVTKNMSYFGGQLTPLFTFTYEGETQRFSNFNQLFHHIINIE